MPPEEPKQRSARRTSISDMVQRYEAIGGRGTPTPSQAIASLPSGPPSPVHRPVSAKAGPSGIGNGPLKIFPDNGKAPSQVTGVSESFTRLGGGDTAKSRTMKEALNHNVSVPRSPTKTRRVSEKVPASTDDALRTRKMSLKTEPFSSTSNTRPEPFTAVRKAATTQNLQSVQPPRSPRKATLTIPQNPPSNADEPPNSPSPDRPYQGVGKLIDQWQKKSAEAEQSRPVQAKRIVVPKTFI